MSADELRKRVLNFLYGEMSPEEEAAFRAELEENPALARVLAAEERFQEVCPVGAGSEVGEEALGEARLLLRAALRREARQPPSLLSRLAGYLGKAVPQVAYAGGVVGLLLGGILLGRTALAPERRGGEGPLAGVPGLPDELQVVDLSVAQFDPATGIVKLSLSAFSRLEVEGRLQDAVVQSALAAALRGDAGPGARLEAAELLGYQTASAEIRRALVYSLLHDENPGVRLKAVEALQELAGDEQVREALRTALRRDVNPGVRVAAIEALREFRDQATLQVLKRQMRVDDNEYIRAEARRALEKWRAVSVTQQL